VVIGRGPGAARRFVARARCDGTAHAIGRTGVDNETGAAY